jgi:hypothetical protein
MSILQPLLLFGVGRVVARELSSGRSPHWLTIKNPKAPPVTREAEEDWGH